MEHIIKDHGESGATDQSMRDVNDIARIQYVLDNYDSVETGGKSSAYVYQNEHGRNVGAQTVVFKKKVNGTYFVVEAVPDSSKKQCSSILPTCQWQNNTRKLHLWIFVL